MEIIWYMIPEMQSEIDRIFLSFWSIFCPFSSRAPAPKKTLKKWNNTSGGTINDHHMMHGSWDMECDRQNFFIILSQFLPFYLTHDPKTQNFEKITPGDIIILHKCTKNHDHMLSMINDQCSWDIAHDWCNFNFSFWAIFCPFIPLTTWKIKNFENDAQFWRYGGRQTDGQTDWWMNGWTDEWMEKVTYRVGAPFKNF